MSDIISKDISKIIESENMQRGKQKVLLASIELFAEYGFSSTSTSMISEKAGVSQATIFKYFKSKEKLLDYVLQLVIENLVPSYSNQVLKNIKNKSNNAEMLINFIINDRYDFMIANKNLVLIFMTEFLTNDELLEQLFLTLKGKSEIMSRELENIISNQSTISGLDLIKLMISQLLTLFLNQFRLNKGNSNFDYKSELNRIEELIIKIAIDK